jgi:TatD DNase family protein
MMNLIDIGANLTHESFDRDRAQVLERAWRVGVRQLVVTGATRHGSHQALALAKDHRGQLFATAGLHPHHAHDFNDEAEAEFAELHQHELVVAVGECGLDYFRDFSPRSAQAFAFEQQLKLAQRCGKPLFLHQRDAHTDFMAILRNAGKLPRIVVHCFTGSEPELEEYLACGYYIGITGWICDERRGRHLLEAVNRIPSERLMIETDAPYLLPRSLPQLPKDRRNEPLYLPEVLRVIAAARGEDVTQLADEVAQTTRGFFGLPGAN